MENFLDTMQSYSYKILKGRVQTNQIDLCKLITLIAANSLITIPYNESLALTLL